MSDAGKSKDRDFSLGGGREAGKGGTELTEKKLQWRVGGANVDRWKGGRQYGNRRTETQAKQKLHKKKGAS